jgi:tetratricopeptide (TPR) repeat protein
MVAITADATAVAAGLAAIAVLTAIGGWFALRLRGADSGLRAARRALEAGDYQTALGIARRHRPAPTAAPKPWHEEQWQLETECLYAGGEAALRDSRFSEAIAFYQAVGLLVGLDETEAAHRVVEAMLAEARRLSAAEDTSVVLPQLLGLILERQSPCPEASFWLGLYHLRRGDAAAGVAALTAAHDAGEGHQVDPALYLGAVWLRDGKPREALRVLAEANRLAPNCPLVSWQLGAALIESGGDVLLALRALQKATAADGLPKFIPAPHRLWAETLPADSWVRNLAQRATSQRAHFRCPLGMDQLASVYQSARLALAEALVTCDRADEAAPIFAELLTTEDTLRIRRGLGLALCQLNRPDDALPHLKKAHAEEQPPSAITIGALAASLAAARGDRAANVRQALALIASLNVRADAAWARRAGTVFAVAETAGVPVSASQVTELAAVLASTDAADATAAAVYELLAARTPTAIPHEIARLYVRAAQRQGVNLPHDEQLFDRVMADRKAARGFFNSREWDFDAVERLYLERWAVRHPGTFPTAPGPGYAAEAEMALLADARRLEAQNRPATAREVVQLVLKLNPASGPTHDRLAEMAYRRGDRAEAADWLRKWRDRSPADPLPLARLAALAATENRPSEALAATRQALERVQGAVRVPFLLLAARLALAAGKPTDAGSILDECLNLDPDHPVALAGRVALAWAEGKFPRLIRLSDRMATVQAEDPWFHYLAGASLLLAGQLDAAELSAKYAAGQPATTAEGRHLLALIRDRRNDTAGAADLLRDPAVTGGAAGDHAFALRGQAAWRGGDYAEALRCWEGLPPARLKTWNLATLLGGTAFLAGVQALRADDPEEAARWLRQAAKLGHADPRLESLLTVACTQAGARSDPTRGVVLLEQALEAGGPRPEIVRLLARAYRQAGRTMEARLLLDGAPADDAALALERGMLFVAEGQLVPAERALSAALAHDPQSAAACINLVFTRLSLGRLADALELLPRAAELAPTPDTQRLLEHLRVLAIGSKEAPAGWTVDDDRQVVECLRSLGRLDTVEALFAGLHAIRGQSSVVKQALAELVPLQVKSRIDRGDPAAVRGVLEAHSSPHASALVRNLLGVCASLRHDFPRAVRLFQAALPPIGDDARVQQNLALIRGWTGDATRSAAHWQRFLELQATQTPKPHGVSDYHRRIAALVRDKLIENVDA